MTLKPTSSRGGSGSGTVSGITSNDGSLTVTDPAGPTTDLAVVSAPGGYNALAQGLGYQAWTFDPILANAAATQDNTKLAAVYLSVGQTITGLAVPVVVAGSGLTTARVGIYDLSLALVATSGDNLAGFEATGWVSTALSSPYLVPAAGAYFLASGFTGSVTPSVLSFQQNAALSTGYPQHVRSVEAQVASGALPNPAVPQGTFSNVPCLIAY